MGTTLPNKGFTVPTVNSDFGIWGTELNAGFIQLIDGALGGVEVLSSAATIGGDLITIQTSQAYNAYFEVAANSTAALSVVYLSSAWPNGLLCWDNENSTSLVTTVSQNGGSPSINLAPSFGRQLIAASPSGGFFFANDAHYKPAGLGVFADAGGQAIPPGATVGAIRVPFPCNIVGLTMLADTTAGIEVDIWRSTAIGTYPPSAANSITGSCVPTLSGSQTLQNNTLSGWTTFLNAGDVLVFNAITGSTGVTKLSMALQVTR